MERPEIAQETLLGHYPSASRGWPRPVQSGEVGLEGLHHWFIDRLVLACAALLEMAVAARAILPDLEAVNLKYGVGKMCVDIEGGRC
jgi:hypothetical protein